MRKAKYGDQLNVRLPHKLMTVATTVADREARTLSDLVREGIIEALKRRGIKDWRRACQAERV